MAHAGERVKLRSSVMIKHIMQQNPASTSCEKKHAKNASHETRGSGCAKDDDNTLLKMFFLWMKYAKQYQMYSETWYSLSYLFSFQFFSSFDSFEVVCINFA